MIFVVHYSILDASASLKRKNGDTELLLLMR